MFAFYSPYVKALFWRSLARYIIHQSPMRRQPLSLVTGLLLGTLMVGGVYGQELLRLGQDGNGYLGASDLAVLSSDETRNDLPCKVEPLDPELEYDLNFRAGYNAEIPLSSLAGTGNLLRVVFRITPLDTPEEPVYMKHRYGVPAIEAGASGSANLPGKYRLGPGRYKVNWLMRDQAERVCASHWEIAAETVEEFEKLATTPTTSLAAPFSEEIFYDEPPVMRPRGKLRHVKLMINFTPTNQAMARLNAYDLNSVVSMVRAIAKEPQFGLFSVVAYQSQRERVFFEQDRASQIDFPALGEAMADVQGGSVDITNLQDKESGRHFLRELFEKHLVKTEDEPDAIIFLGPKLVFDRSPESAVLSAQQFTKAPVFYFVFNRNPRAYPWRDAISAGLSNHAISEFNISQAKDFGQALRETLLRLEQAETVSAASDSSSR